MDVNNEKFDDLCIGYLQDSLTPAEQKEFDFALKSANEEQKRSFLDFQKVTMLTYGTNVQAPPPRIKFQIMDAVKRSQRTVGSRISDWIADNVMATMGYAVAAMAFVLSAGQLQKNLELSRSNREQAKQLAQINQVQQQQTELVERLKAQAQVNTQEREKALRNEQLLAVLQSQDAVITNMKGLDASPKSSARVVWSVDQKTAFLQVFNLPVPPPDKDYQLWVMDGNTPIPADVFAFAEEGGVTINPTGLSLWDKKRMKAFVVTLEPKGGVKAPTGPAFLKGTI